MRFLVICQIISLIKRNVLSKDELIVFGVVYFIEPYIYGSVDCYGYYVVANDGVLYWMMHPMAGYNPTVINQNEG